MQCPIIMAGPSLLDMLSHLEFNIKDVQSTTTVQLIRRLELLFTECAVNTTTYGSQGLSGIARKELSMDRSQRTSRTDSHRAQRNFPPCAAIIREPFAFLMRA